MPLKTVLDSPELQQKVNGFSWQFLIGVLVAGASAGYGYAKIHSQDEQMKAQMKLIELQHENTIKTIDIKFQWTLEEIGGLRNDMNREVLLIRKEIDELKQKLKE